MQATLIATANVKVMLKAWKTLLHLRQLALGSRQKSECNPHGLGTPSSFLSFSSIQALSTDVSAGPTSLTTMPRYRLRCFTYVALQA